MLYIHACQIMTTTLVACALFFNWHVTSPLFSESVTNLLARSANLTLKRLLRVELRPEKLEPKVLVSFLSIIFVCTYLHYWTTTVQLYRWFYVFRRYLIIGCTYFPLKFRQRCVCAFSVAQCLPRNTHPAINDVTCRVVLLSCHALCLLFLNIHIWILLPQLELSIHFLDLKGIQSSDNKVWTTFSQKCMMILESFAVSLKVFFSTSVITFSAVLSISAFLYHWNKKIESFSTRCERRWCYNMSDRWLTAADISTFIPGVSYM